MQQEQNKIEHSSPYSFFVSVQEDKTSTDDLDLAYAHWMSQYKTQISEKKMNFKIYTRRVFLILHTVVCTILSNRCWNTSRHAMVVFGVEEMNQMWKKSNTFNIFLTCRTFIWSGKIEQFTVKYQFDLHYWMLKIKLEVLNIKKSIRIKQNNQEYSKHHAQ